MTLETVRAAALATDPYTRMDELVRAELSAGRSVRQITKAYLPLLDDALETPGLTEDGEEALRGTLDALTGDCHKDCQYRDPPNPHLPSEEEIVELPRWARVAFAARCVRRVRPLAALVPAGLPPLTRENAQAINESISSGEFAAARPRNEEFVILERLKGTAAWILIYATNGSADSTGRNDTAYAISQVMAFAVASAVHFSSIVPHIRRDFDRLAHLAEVRRWDDNTPVPPDVFGPLWPEGAPKGWPANTDVYARSELMIEAFAGDEAKEKKIEDDLVNLFNALNRYHIARSGKRLTLEQFRSLVSSHAIVEV